MPWVAVRPSRRRSHRFLLTILVWASVLACAASAFAADNGLVVLKNGSRIAGEVKSLQLGKLELSTVSMGTVYVEWDKVIELTSPDYFEVELSSGARYYGTLGPAAGAMLSVTLNGRSQALAMLSVVRLRRLQQSFWSRLDGSISLGASYTQSSGIGQTSLSADIGARRPRFEWATRLDSAVTVQPDEPEQTRTSFVASYHRLMPNRWFLLASGKAEHNSEIGLQLRTSGAGGAGRYFLQTNRSLLGGAAGISVNREVPVDGETTSNTEAFFAASYEFFTYDTPKTSITATFVVYPSLSVGGRVRTDADLSLKREIVSDFTIGATFYDTYDNKPVSADARKHDLGFTLSVGWVF